MESQFAKSTYHGRRKTETCLRISTCIEIRKSRACVIGMMIKKVLYYTECFLFSFFPCKRPKKSQLLSRIGQKLCFSFIFFENTHNDLNKTADELREFNRIKFDRFPLLRTNQACLRMESRLFITINMPCLYEKVPLFADSSFEMQRVEPHDNSALSNG